MKRVREILLGDDEMKRVREVIEALIVAGLTLTLVMNALAEIPWPDSRYYFTMVAGESAPDPFGRRVLIPFLASLFVNLSGCDAISAFLILNLGFTFLAGLILLREHDLLTALIALGCTGALVDYFGKALLDAGMFFFVVLALYFAPRNKLALFCVVLLSTMVHPMVFVLCSIIFVFNLDDWRLLPTVAIPGVFYYLLFMPTSYAVIILHGPIAILSALKMLNVQWLGAFTLRFDRQSMMILAMFGACCAFSLLLTWPARAFVMLSPVLAPRLKEMISARQGENEKRLTQDSSSTNNRHSS